MQMSTSVDNRPKKILVAGYTPDEKDKVLAHFNVNISFDLFVV